MVNNTWVPTICKYPDLLGERERKLRTLKLGTDSESSVGTKVTVMVLKKCRRGRLASQRRCSEVEDREQPQNWRKGQQARTKQDLGGRKRPPGTGVPCFEPADTHLRLQTPSEYKVIHPNSLRLCFAAIYGRWHFGGISVVFYKMGIKQVSVPKDPCRSLSECK